MCRGYDDGGGHKRKGYVRGRGEEDWEGGSWIRMVGEEAEEEDEMDE